MFTIPQKPDGSVIEVIQEGDEYQLRWTLGANSHLQSLMIVTMALWLVGWGIGWLSVLPELFRWDPNSRAFLLMWFCLWTAGGIVAIRSFVGLLDPYEPESITLGSSEFQFDSGNLPGESYNNMWTPGSWSRTVRYPDDLNLYSFGGGRKRVRVKILKAQMQPLTLDKVGASIRLHVHRGNEKFEIGRFCNDAERNWLATTIEAWRVSESNCG